MKTSEQVDQIIPAMHRAIEKIEAVHKTKKNTAMNYRYAGIEDILAAVEGALYLEGIVVISSVLDHENLPPIPTARGGQLQRVIVGILTRFFHVSGQWIEVSSRGEGTDSGDKSIYKAITGGRKYALLSGLNLITTDDPERPNQLDKEASPNRMDAKRTATEGRAPSKMKGRY